MKATTEQHIKFKRLQMKLGGLPLWQTKGLLESLWNLCATSTPCGNIGKFSNEDICASIEWSDDPDILIKTLIDCGWIDECVEQRLIIHNWNLHCPTYIKGNLAKHNKSFFVAKQVTKQPAKQDANSSVLPSLSKPIQAKPDKTNGEQAHQVFTFWQTNLDHKKAKLSNGRRRLIEKQLKLYTVNDLKHAIAGCTYSEWHMGKNPENKVYDSIELILRDSKNIEGFMGVFAESHHG